MAKLNPPYIENILPPFITNENIVIPFEFNRTTIADEIDENKVKILIRNPLSNAEIKLSNDNIGIINLSNQTMIFENQGNFQSGNYYKIQVAFIDKNTGQTGYYSNVGIARCIEKLGVRIEGEDTLLNSTVSVNNMGYKYRGICTLNEPTEKIYSYCFSLTNPKTEQIIYTTGEKIHDTSKDTSSTESIDTCYIPIVLDFENEYLLNYSVTTINGYKQSASPIRLKSGDTVNLSLGNNVLIAEPDHENGTIIIKFQKKNINYNFTPMYYNFILLRSSSKDNFSTWDRISILDEDNSKNLFLLENALLIDDEQILWEDMTVEHGVSYKYAIQAYNSYGLLSNKIESNLYEQYDDNGTLIHISSPTQINFEDMYLNDGEKQLKIRFNPKVSSLKNTILESKMDTIGSKYPFFFRNGTVNYKEFPISGLISLLMDSDDKFKVGLYNVQKGIGTKLLNGTKTDLTHENIKNEREFKLEVLEWLTNGQPKIFRSPTEGNYLVRLMNTSLTPNDTLGRMLHTFSCTAYEIDSYNFETLHKYGFINCETKSYKLASFMGEVDINLKEQLEKQNGPTIILPNAYKVTICDSRPYEAIYRIGFSSGESIDVQIGKNGIYEIPTLSTSFITSISWKNWEELKVKYLQDPSEINNASFKVFYAYYDKTNLTNFHFIKNITYVPAVVQQIGEFKFLDPNNFNNWNNQDGINIPPEQISTLATWGVREIDKLYHITIKRRPLIPIYSNGKDLYFNRDLTDKFSYDNKKFLLQGLYVLESGDVYDYFNYTDLSNNIITPKILNINDEGLFEYTFNEKTFSLYTNNLQGSLHNTDDKYKYTEFELNTDLLANTSLDKLIIGNGLILEITYLAKDLHYDFSNYSKDYSDEISEVEYYKKIFQRDEGIWKQLLLQNMSIYRYLRQRKRYEKSYLDYVQALGILVSKLTKNQEVNIV